MLKYITVKYYTENEFAKEPYQATEHSAGYDVFAAETKTFLPKTVDTILLELRWAVLTGFYGKLCPRSGLLREHFVSIDSDLKPLLFVLVIELLRLFLWKNLMQTFTG